MHIIFKREEDRGKGKTTALFNKVCQQCNRIMVVPSEVARTYVIRNAKNLNPFMETKFIESKVVVAKKFIYSANIKDLEVYVDEGIDLVTMMKLIQLSERGTIQIKDVIIADYTSSLYIKDESNTHGFIHGAVIKGNIVKSSEGGSIWL